MVGYLALAAFCLTGCDVLRDGKTKKSSSKGKTKAARVVKAKKGKQRAGAQNKSPRGPAKGPSGFSRKTLSVAGTKRTVSFYAGEKRSGRPPLVLAFHGTSGNAAEWVSGHDPSGIESLADHHGFVVAAPDSRFIAKSDWDHEYEGGDKYWQTAAPDGSNPKRNPDLQLVTAVLAAARTTYGVDSKRIYAIGFSNGGFFALLTAMALRDRIAAFAVAGAGLVTCRTTRSCKAQSSSTSCATIVSRSGCNCSGSEKPTTIRTSGRLVPGYVGHNNRDDVVSSVYSCSLYQRMKALSYRVEVMIVNDAGHGVPEGFLPKAWSFLAAQQLP